MRWNYLLSLQCVHSLHSAVVFLPLKNQLMRRLSKKIGKTLRPRTISTMEKSEQDHSLALLGKKWSKRLSYLSLNRPDDSSFYKTTYIVDEIVVKILKIVQKTRFIAIKI